MSFIEDNLLTRASGITHHGTIPEADEELSPSLENFVVFMWLQLLHPSLPRLVKQRYGTELCSRTLASVKPEISQALDSLLDELHTSEEAKVMRTAFSNSGKPPQPPSHLSPSYQQPHPPKPKPAYRPRPTKSCTLCFQAGRPDHRSHFLSTCPYLPESDRWFMSKVRHVADIDDTPVYEENPPDDDDFNSSSSPPYRDHNPASYPSARRVNVTRSPYLHVFFNEHSLRLTIDTGAESNMIKTSLASYIGASITKSSQQALQADGHTPLTIVGETRSSLSRNDRTLTLEALVVENLDVDILAGTPFMACNDIAVRPATQEIVIAGCDIVSYGSSSTPSKTSTVRCFQILRAPPVSSTIWPGNFLEVNVPNTFPSDAQLAIEPRVDSACCRSTKTSHAWPQPALLDSVGGKLRLVNPFSWSYRRRC